MGHFAITPAHRFLEAVLGKEPAQTILGYGELEWVIFRTALAWANTLTIWQGFLPGTDIPLNLTSNGSDCGSCDFKGDIFVKGQSFAFNNIGTIGLAATISVALGCVVRPSINLDLKRPRTVKNLEKLGQTITLLVKSAANKAKED